MHGLLPKLTNLQVQTHILLLKKHSAANKSETTHLTPKHQVTDHPLFERDNQLVICERQMSHLEINLQERSQEKQLCTESRKCCE
jgi:hypothetical protein